MASSKPPTRLICCVDGTYFTPDGSDGKGHGNITNVYRIYASVKTGKCFDKITGKEYFQRKIYEQGIGSTDDLNLYDKTRAGVWGIGFGKIIRKIYEECSQLDADDEIWLYGFSRGAYIVRAVAGLLHWIWALQSAGSDRFEAEFSKALRFYVDHKEQRSRSGPGQVSQKNAMQLSMNSQVSPFPKSSAINFHSFIASSHQKSNGLLRYNLSEFLILSKLCGMKIVSIYPSMTLYDTFVMHSL